MTQELLDEIDRLFEMPADRLADDAVGRQARQTFGAFLDQLESGQLRAAKPRRVSTDDDADNAEGSSARQQVNWEVQASVKRGILLGFRLGHNTPTEPAGPLHFRDKDTYPAQQLDRSGRDIRVVPGGTAVRRGSYIGEQVTIMAPAYVNVGAYVDDATMVDSHALVGSCAQIGKNVHLSAGAQIGGVLEPIGQAPVIVEDEVLVGGNTGLYEGVQVGRGAVIGAGCVVTASTPVYDTVRQQVYRGQDDQPLKIPPGAVVVPGTRPASGEFARAKGLQMAALLIIKYRDASTDAATALEEMLR